MKKIFIFLSVFIITFIAFLDAKDRINELDEKMASTPAQMEIRKPMNNREIESQTLKNQDEERRTPDEKLRINTKQHLQQSSDNILRHQEQQRKQRSQLHWR